MTMAGRFSARRFASEPAPVAASEPLSFLSVEPAAAEAPAESPAEVPSCRS